VGELEKLSERSYARVVPVRPVPYCVDELATRSGSNDYTYYLLVLSLRVLFGLVVRRPRLLRVVYLPRLH